MANITMALEDTLLKEARRLAIERKTTLNNLIRIYLSDFVRREPCEKKVIIKKLEKHFMRNSRNLKDISWNRDELYER